ncbi:MAG: XRE family transcriptional regulator [Candidatus Cloacimonetes bacterium]|nr:XRE family transcriptional regulator [Candidatus Cloacimonadota bacterium]
MNEIFAKRFRSARLKSGLSLQALAERTDDTITRQAISKYEHGKAMPDSKKLIKLAKALDVKLEYFFRPVKTEVELPEPAYRKRSAMSKRRLAMIHENVKDLIERYLEAENIMCGFKSVKLPDDSIRRVSSFEDVEHLAENIREIWNLGQDPIESIVDVLEDNLFKVALIDSDENFDGLSCWGNGEIPIIISRKNCSGDRQRSNLAHELGHLLMDVSKSFDEEKAAYRFSASFLVPKAVAIRELGIKRKNLNWEELLILKQKYGMSVQQWVYRAKDLGIISESHSKSWFIRFSELDRKKEFGTPIAREIPMRMRKLVFQGIAEKIISPSKAAELLACNLNEIRKSILGFNS